MTTKTTLKSLAKSIKFMDESLWTVVRYSPEYESISASRKNLITIVFESGYELTKDYRVIKSKAPRSIND